MVKPMYQIDYRIKMQPTEIKPYELEYKINILDNGFRERLDNLQELKFVIFQKETFFRSKLKLSVIQQKDLEIYGRYKDLIINEKAAIYFETEQEAEKYLLELEKALNKFLEKQQKEYIELSEKAKIFNK